MGSPLGILIMRTISERSWMSMSRNVASAYLYTIVVAPSYRNVLPVAAHRAASAKALIDCGARDQRWISLCV
jgi:hypothetical protein